MAGGNRSRSGVVAQHVTLLRIKRLRGLPSVGIVFLVACVMSSLVQAEDINLEPFSIPDQFDVIHTADEVRDSVVIFLRTDRKSFKYNPEWVEAINAELIEVPGVADVMFVYLAHMKGVPGFLRGMIKKKFPQDRSIWMLLDWKGDFEASYGFTKGAVNVLIFNRQGVLVYRDAVTEVEPSQLHQMVPAVRTALGEQSESVD